VLALSLIGPYLSKRASLQQKSPPKATFPPKIHALPRPHVESLVIAKSRAFVKEWSTVIVEACREGASGEDLNMSSASSSEQPHLSI
jgi:hypothetical protein